MKRVLYGLFDSRGRRMLALSAGGMLFISLLDLGAVILVAPLGVVMTGGDVTAGSWAPLWRSLGAPPREQYSAILLVLILVTFIVKDVLTLAIQWWQSGFVSRQGALTRSRLVRYYTTMPWSFYVQRQEADFLNRLSNVGQVYAGVAALVALFSQAVSVLAVALALLILNPIVTLVLFVFFALVGWLYARLSNGILRTYNHERIRWELQQNAVTLRVFGGAKEIRLRNAQLYFDGLYEEATMGAARVVRRAGFIQGLPKYVLEIIFIVALSMVVLISYSVGAGDDLIPLLALVAVAAFRSLPALSGAVGSANTLAAARPSVDLVLQETDALAQFEEHRDRALKDLKPPSSDKVTGTDAIEISQLRYRYREDLEDVLRGVNLTIEKGKSTALVGGSGAGKSTLVDLLLGLLTPSSGTISVNGHDIHDDLEAWQRQLAVVPQAVYLLDGTVAENVVFDRAVTPVDEAEIWRVLEQAEMADTVRGLEQGIHTRLGDRGARLSGGQRQRLGIARALFRNPAILILDEATSALDNETERKITETVEGLGGDLTLITVAHRLSTVKNADKIVFLDEGHVAAVGDFASVQETSPKFAQLVRLGQLLPSEFSS